MNDDRLNEILGILLFGAAILFLLSLVSFTPDDLSFYVSSPHPALHNWVGKVGAHFSGGIFFLFGLSGYFIPATLLIWAFLKFFGKDHKLLSVRLWGGVTLLLSTCALLSLLTPGNASSRFKSGGLLGLFISDLLQKYLSSGSIVFLGTLFLISLILAANLRVDPILLSFFRTIRRAADSLVARFLRQGRGSPQKRAILKWATEGPSPKKEKEEEAPEGLTRILPPRLRVEKPKASSKIVPVPTPREVGDYRLPSLDLLNPSPPLKERQSRENLQENSRLLEETLREFGIEVKVVQVEPGPVITRYELQPAPGVKVNKITALSDDIALVMKAQSIRIIAPIPGKSAVGVEVPNTTSVMVFLREVLESEEFRNSRSKLTLAIGKDTGGTPLVSDLADMPHLLIAGTTGSGKTVCINTIIASLLYMASPDELKFLMIDPKMVELALFNNLPHLIAPVVTDPKKVKGALAWVVQEMENRYRLLSKLGVRHIDLYNERVEQKKNLPEGEPLDKLPYLVVVIDELADLMMVVPQDVESAITRLAQLSRAVGIHMVLATQRPSVDVLTGVIKANFPARISFKVASKVDSRTVLDMNGADKLVGKGDLLFMKPGMAKPIRAQGALVQDGEIERITEFIRSQRGASFHEGILKDQDKRTESSHAKDDLYEEAVKVILETRHASVSVLQRRFALGYSRAARLIDMMEEEGIVGPFRGSKPREVLVESYEKHEAPQEEAKS